MSYPQENLQVANRISAYVYIQEGTQSPITVLVCKAGRTQMFAGQSQVLVLSFFEAAQGIRLKCSRDPRD